MKEGEAGDGGARTSTSTGTSTSTSTSTSTEDDGSGQGGARAVTAGWVRPVEGVRINWPRRIAVIWLVWLVWLVALTTAPMTLALAGLADLVLRGGRGLRFCRVRALLALGWVLTCEVGGVMLATWMWCARWLLFPGRERWLEANATLQRWWTGALWRGAVRIFSLRVETEGLDAAAPGPYALMVRHASTVDTVLAAALLANPRRLRFRYVLKRELLWDPCLDIVGNRLPNLFAQRGGGEAAREREVAAVARLAAGMGPRDAVLIYPEGTRFSQGKLRQAVDRLRAGGDEALAERAARLRRVLPPRPGGPLALLGVTPALDVVMLAHTGLEGATSLGDLWRGGLVGATVRVKVWRIPAADVPAEPEARLGWLFDRWLEVDQWIQTVQANSSWAPK